jgi:hypothetical protein
MDFLPTSVLFGFKKGIRISSIDKKWGHKVPSARCKPLYTARWSSQPLAFYYFYFEALQSNLQWAVIPDRDFHGKFKLQKSVPNDHYNLQQAGGLRGHYALVGLLSPLMMYIYITDVIYDKN